MENRITEYVLEKTTNVGNLATEPDLEKGKEKVEEEHAGAEENLKSSYNAVSKNGDTLEISETGRMLGAQKNEEDQPLSGKSSSADSEKKISDSALAGYSKAQLKQLYVSKKITKQQYDRFLKKAK